MELEIRHSSWRETGVTFVSVSKLYSATAGHGATVTGLRVPAPFNIYREVAFRFLDLNSCRAPDKKKQEHVWHPLNCKEPSTKAAARVSANIIIACSYIERASWTTEDIDHFCHVLLVWLEVNGIESRARYTSFYDPLNLYYMYMNWVVVRTIRLVNFRSDWTHN